MVCFDDFITVRGNCTDTVPTSGFFFNQIGIDLDELNAIVTKDFDNGEALASDRLDFAVSLVTSDIKNRLASKFRATSIIDNRKIGQYRDNLVLVNGAANTLKGIELELCNNESFVEIYISDISLQTDFNGVVPVQVYDLITGLLLDTINVTTVANAVSSALVNRTYKSERTQLHLIFVYDSTAVNSYTSHVKLKGCSGCGKGSMVILNRFVRSRGISILTSDTKIDTNLDGENNTAGMSINYSVNCAYDDWLCTLRNLLALPILYRAGAEIMEFAIDNSDRLNSKTLIDLDKLEERKVKYGDKYIAEMDNVIKHIKLPSDRHCFDCKPSVRSVPILPA